VPRLSSLFPKAVAAPNILYAGFTNANVMLHVANCVANAGRIESADAYKFYVQGQPLRGFTFARCAKPRNSGSKGQASSTLAGRSVRRGPATARMTPPRGQSSAQLGQILETVA
jgi:uncharacterized ParB-like nuclease family protein